MEKAFLWRQKDASICMFFHTFFFYITNRYFRKGRCPELASALRKSLPGRVYASVPVRASASSFELDVLL
jgi:hypothetical protein